MSAPFQAGDKVVAIDISPPRLVVLGGLPLNGGTTYCVHDCWAVETGGYAVRLMGEPVFPAREGAPYGWDSERFRRIWTQITTVTTSIEQPATP